MVGCASAVPRPESGLIPEMTSTGPGGLDELSRTLRELRLAAGLSGAAAGERADFSQPKISRIEKGVNVPSPADVETLARIYGATADQRRHLRALAEDVRSSYRRVVLPKRANRAKFQERIGRIERSSERIREFSPVIVAGLLQTGDYIRAIFESGGTTPEDAAAAVSARLERKTVLDEPGRRITILMTEGSLGWASVSPPMMVEQMEHIVDVSHKPSVSVGIVPFGVPRGVFPATSWSVYDERIVIPSIVQTQVVLEGSDVQPYVDLTEKVERYAVFGDEAREIVAQAADRYRRMRS